jgi:exodeoxyribonuclease VII small subunit
MKAESSGEELTFSVAIQELEAILQRIDNDAVDIDGLAAELRRATELLELCREKIRKAEVEVGQIVQRLEADPGS